MPSIDFLTRLVAGNETWPHHWDPDTKKVCAQPSVCKVYHHVFWDSKGIILIDYKPSGPSIAGDYYANVIKQLMFATKEHEGGVICFA